MSRPYSIIISSIWNNPLDTFLSNYFRLWALSTDQSNRFLFYQFNPKTAVFQVQMEFPEINKGLMKLHLEGEIVYVEETHTILIPSAFEHNFLNKPDSLDTLFSSPIFDKIPKEHPELLFLFYKMVTSAAAPFRQKARWKRPLEKLEDAMDAIGILDESLVDDFLSQLNETYKKHLSQPIEPEENKQSHHTPLEKGKIKGEKRGTKLKASRVKEKDVPCTKTNPPQIGGEDQNV